MYLNQVESENYKIKKVIENFDFEKCQKVMEFLDWKWVLLDAVPSSDDLKIFAENLIRDAIRFTKEEKKWNQPYWISSGGLKVTVKKNRYNQINKIYLEFILTDWDSE